MADSYSTVEVLDHARCVALLATVHIGRVVFTSRAMPAVRPVRFAVRDDAVWFRMPVSDMWPAGVVDDRLRQARIAPGARAEQLTLAEFARLFAARKIP